MTLPTDEFILLIAFYMLGVALLIHWRRPHPLRYLLRLCALIFVGDIILAAGPIIQAFVDRVFHTGVPNALLFFRMIFGSTEFYFGLMGSFVYAVFPSIATAIFALERTEKREILTISSLVAVIALCVSDIILFARKNLGTFDDLLFSIVSNVIGGIIAGILIGQCAIRLLRITSSAKTMSSRPTLDKLSGTFYAIGCGVVTILLAYFIFGFTPPTPITVKLDQWTSMSFEYTEVYKNESTKLDVIPITATARQLSAYVSGPTDIEWSAKQNRESVGVELELFTASADMFIPNATFPILLVDPKPFYRGGLPQSKFRLATDGMAFYWIRSKNMRLGFATAVRRNAKVQVENEWQHTVIQADERQSQHTHKGHAGLGFGGNGALISVGASEVLEFVILPGTAQGEFKPQTEEILALVRDKKLINFHSESLLPTLSVQPFRQSVSSSKPVTIYPMILGRLKSAGDISLTFRTPSRHIVFDNPTFNLDAFGFKTGLRNIVLTKPIGEMQLGGTSHKLKDDIFIDGPWLTINRGDSSKLLLRGRANLVLVDSMQIIPTIAQSLGKEIWAGLIGGIIATLGAFLAVWWPKRKRNLGSE